MDASTRASHRTGVPVLQGRVKDMGDVKMRFLRIVVGLIAWITAGVLLLIWVRGQLLAPEADGHRVASDLWAFATAERRMVKLQLEGDWPLGVGDPIYRIDGPDEIQQVGEIRRIDRGEPGDPNFAVGRLLKRCCTPSRQTCTTDRI